MPRSCMLPAWKGSPPECDFLPSGRLSPSPPEQASSACSKIFQSTQTEQNLGHFIARPYYLPLPHFSDFDSITHNLSPRRHHLARAHLRPSRSAIGGARRSCLHEFWVATGENLLLRPLRVHPTRRSWVLRVAGLRRVVRRGCRLLHYRHRLQRRNSLNRQLRGCSHYPPRLGRRSSSISRLSITSPLRRR